MQLKSLFFGSREIPENALDKYEGAIMSVSQDRYFINRLAETDGKIKHVEARINSPEFTSDYIKIAELSDLQDELMTRWIELSEE